MFSSKPQTTLSAPTRSAGFFLTNTDGVIVRVCLLHGNPFACFLPPNAPDDALVGLCINAVFAGAAWQPFREAWHAQTKAVAPQQSTGQVFPPQHTGYEFHIQTAETGTVVYLYELEASDVGVRYWHSTGELLCLLSASGVILDASPSWNHFTRLGAVRGANAADWIHADDKNRFQALCQSAGGLSAAPRKAVVRMRVDAAQPFRWMQWELVPDQTETCDSNQTLWLACARDVTETHDAEANLLWRAHHDPLTDLPNRALLNDRLRHALAGAQRRKHGLAVLFLDINRLKPINDTHGHGAGDAVLREVARRFKSCLRDEDTVARLGGDEFVVVLPVVGAAEDAVRVGRKLLDVLSTPIALENSAAWNTSPVKISASVGISLFPHNGHDADTLIKNADSAMYRAKKQKWREPCVFEDGDRAAKNGTFPANGFSFGAAETSPDPSARFGFSTGSNNSGPENGTGAMERSLSRAVDRDEMRLHYQPQVSLSTGQTTGVEALLRWNNADWGSVPPATFIPLAEEAGLMVPLGAWALQEACRQGADWKKCGHAVSVAVNVSARQLGERTFPDLLLRWLDGLGMPPSRVDLEMRETALASVSPDASLQTLRQLKKMGVRLSVDDWGTGSLSGAPARLEKYPLDSLKIDRSYIQKMNHSEAHHEVVQAVIDWGHTLGMRVIAEGVETTEQRDLLTALGCDAMQGYLISAAVPPGDVRAFFE